MKIPPHPELATRVGMAHPRLSAKVMTKRSTFTIAFSGCDQQTDSTRKFLVSSLARLCCQGSDRGRVVAYAGLERNSIGVRGASSREVFDLSLSCARSQEWAYQGLAVGFMTTVTRCLTTKFR